MTTNDLQAAIETGDQAAVVELLTADASIAHQKTETGISWVLQAMYYRQPAIAKQIAAAKGQLDIHEAAATGDVKRSQNLLDEHNDALEAIAPDGFRPLHLAAFFAHENVVALLIERGAEVATAASNPTSVHPLHSAAAAHSVPICERLLRAGAQVDARQQAGYTALMAAAMGGNQELVDLLLAHGADPSLESEAGQSAADLAREQDHKVLAQQLETR